MHLQMNLKNFRKYGIHTIFTNILRRHVYMNTFTLVSLLLAGTIFKIHDLAGINFSNFIISRFDTYQVLSGSPSVSSKD